VTLSPQPFSEHFVELLVLGVIHPNVHVRSHHHWPHCLNRRNHSIIPEPKFWLELLKGFSKQEIIQSLLAESLLADFAPNFAEC
jgi:hypothetical protein